MNVTGRTSKEIRFRCSRCTTELGVPTTRAETTILCPFCQATCLVPKESSRPIRTEVYSTLSEGQSPPETPGIVVVCHRCKTRLDAAPEQIGAEIPCPECRAMVLVTRPKPATDSSPAVTVAVDDIYKVCPGVDQPPLDNKVVYQRYIPVSCPRCGTRTHATEDQVGRTIPCPDCGTPSPVLAPAPKPEVARPKTDEIYGVCSGAEPAVQLRYGETLCPVCHTRLPYPEDQAGRKVSCPDCGSPVVIAPPRAPAPGPLPDDEDSGPDLVVGDPEECGTFWGQILRSARAAAGSVAEGSAVPTMPRWPLVTGIVSFLFRPEILRLWLMFSACFATFVLSVYVAARAGNTFSSSSGLSIVGVSTGVVCATLIVFCVMMLFLWAVFGGPCLIAIVRDTALGHDEIDWPSESWIYRCLEVLYWINGLVMAWVAGGFLGFGLSLLGLPSTPGHFAGVLGGFPFVFLSMLETGSPWDPCSPVLCRSLWRAWRGWIAFYLETTLLFLAVVTVGDQLLLRFDSWLGILVICLLTGAAVILYFRLLGRLAWYCATKTSVKKENRKENSEAPT